MMSEIIMFCIGLFYGFFIRYLVNRVKAAKATRLYPENVKPGDVITIESKRIRGGLGKVTCISNDHKKKKILVEIIWDNATPTVERWILKYKGYELQHLHLLNHIQIPSIQTDDPTDIVLLQKRLNECLEIEAYEQADKIQKQIDALLKKNK